jgi:hypothetical protein
MCGGTAKTPEEKDFSTEKSLYAAQQNDLQQSTASRYNTAANDYNTYLSDFGNRLSSFTSQLGNLSIADKDKIDSLYGGLNGLLDEADNARTVNFGGLSAPTSFGNQYSSTLADLQSRLAAFPTYDLPNRPGVHDPGADERASLEEQIKRLQSMAPGTSTTQGPGDFVYNGIMGFNYEKPAFQSTVIAPFGAGEMVQLNSPSLVSANTSLGQQYLEQIQSGLSKLEGLRGQRQSEIERVNSQKSATQLALDDLIARANGLSMTDTAGAAALQAELAGLRRQATGFNSALLPELGGLDLARTGEIEGRLTSLNDQRAAEKQRIDSYRTGLFGQLDQYRNQLGSLSIADLDGINAFDNNIDTLAREANRFSSPLGADFSGALSEYNQIDSQVEALRAKRAAEEARIRQIQQSLASTGTSLAGQARTTDALNFGGLQALQDALSSARSQITGFESPLSADFSGANSALDAASAAIEQRLAERATRVGEFNTLADTITGGVDDLEAYDEVGMTSRLNQANAQLTNLSGMTGDDIAALRGKYMSATTNLQTKLASLQTERTNIEQAARQALNRIKQRQYYGTTDVEAERTGMTELSDKISLYNAQQALDELDSIETFLSNQDSRLAADASTGNAVADAEKKAVLDQLNGGSLSFPNYGGAQGMGEAEYLQYLTAKRQYPDLTPAMYTSFARAMGVA